jgi:hypothetical protein
MAADLQVLPPYGEAVTYEYRTAPRVVVEEAAPVVSETVVIRRPVVVAPPPPVVVEEYPVYAAPRPYAYAAPVWGHRWGYRRYFHGGW